jgi:hypothetical protein
MALIEADEIKENSMSKDYKHKPIRKVRTASKEEMTKRDACYELDDLRQDHAKSSQRDRLAHEKKQREAYERATGRIA